MSEAIKILDVVALTQDVAERGLSRGQVGTVVESLAANVYEVEFCDNEGRTYAALSVGADHLMVLHYRPLPLG